MADPFTFTSFCLTAWLAYKSHQFSAEQQKLDQAPLMTAETCAELMARGGDSGVPVNLGYWRLSGQLAKASTSDNSLLPTDASLRATLTQAAKSVSQFVPKAEKESVIVWDDLGYVDASSTLSRLSDKTITLFKDSYATVSDNLKTWSGQSIDAQGTLARIVIRENYAREYVNNHWQNASWREALTVAQVPLRLQLNETVSGTGKTLWEQFTAHSFTNVPSVLVPELIPNSTLSSRLHISSEFLQPLSAPETWHSWHLPWTLPSFLSQPLIVARTTHLVQLHPTTPCQIYADCLLVPSDSSWQVVTARDPMYVAIDHDMERGHGALLSVLERQRVWWRRAFWCGVVMTISCLAWAMYKRYLRYQQRLAHRQIRQRQRELHLAAALQRASRETVQDSQYHSDDEENRTTSFEPFTDAESLPDRCAVCRIAKRDALLLPCRHVSLCVACAQKCNDCPMCREPVGSHMRVYVS